MVFGSNEYVRFPAGGRMLRCGAGGARTFAASFPVVSWQCAKHGTVEKRYARYQLEMGALKIDVVKSALASRVFSLVVKPELNLYL